MSKSLSYIFRSGKNPKYIYYGINMFRQILPSFLFRFRRNYYLRKIENHPDKDYIISRVNYYNKLAENASLSDKASLLKDHKLTKQYKVYFFDSYEFTRYFPKNFKWGYMPGDVITVPEIPSVVKSRPLNDENENSVVMKLEKNRHFTFLKDSKPFSEKMNKVIFRGKIHGKSIRVQLMEMYFDHPMCDFGDVGRHPEIPQKWKTGKMTLYEHLDYKFIMSLEGNDVASNLKWVMSSNSIAVMPKPTCETWFMEGTLIPNYHYIEIKEDLSDLEERLNYYIEHEYEALEIIKHAHEYVEMFLDEDREFLLSILVLDKYFQKMGLHSK